MIPIIFVPSEEKINSLTRFFMVHRNVNNLIRMSLHHAKIPRMGLCLRFLLQHSDNVVIYDFSGCFPSER